MPVERTGASKSLLEFADRVLEGGIIIVDREVLVSILGLELLALEAQVVTLSAQRYLEYAEAVGLIPLESPRHVTEYVTRRQVRWRAVRMGGLLSWLLGFVTGKRRGA
jgi:hypothetical protein